MKQAIAGVAPPESGEATVMTIWPTLGATAPGRLIGRLCMIQLGIGWLTLGNILALMLIPVALGLFFFMLAPFASRRYRLTNRRLLIEKGLKHLPDRWVELDRFDRIDVVVQPGQEFYPAGDLIFKKGPIETFRLTGVRRPETFRQVCLKVMRGYGAVRELTAR